MFLNLPQDVGGALEEELMGLILIMPLMEVHAY